jgi:TPR repeat protein
MRFFLILVLLLLAPGCRQQEEASPATPPPLPEGGSAFEAARLELQAGRFAAAAALYGEAAEQGDAGAQFSLGVLHALGAGVPRDVELALGWYEKSAEQADRDAQYALAQRLEQGVPGRTDDGAGGWLERLSRLGEPTNPLRVGSDYPFGTDGLAADPERAAEWYRRAAEQAHVMAWYRLGEMRAGGLGVEGDRVRAHMWFTLCAELELGGADAWKRELEGLMTEEQLAKSAELVREWKATTPEPDPLPEMPKYRPAEGRAH